VSGRATVWPRRRPASSSFSYRRERLDREAAREAAAASRRAGGARAAPPTPVSATRDVARQRTRRAWAALALVLVAAVGATVAVLLVRGGSSSTPANTASSTPANTASSTPANTAATQQRASHPRTNVLGTPHARKFGWARVRHASGYSVAFFRAGRAVFRSRTSSPEVVLPRSWRYHGRRVVLRPGRYTWTVRPLFGSRTGSTVVRANFVLEGS
jgi:hypothetical protein